jgi:hypothetical protein
MESDYIYRFKIDTDEKFDRLREDPVEELIERTIRSLLEIGCFTCNGNLIQVDGFALHNNSAHIRLFKTGE